MRYDLETNPTVFGKLLRGELPVRKVYEDDLVLAFHDIAPKAPVHVVIIPKQHMVSLQDVGEADEALMGHLIVAANKIAEQLGVKDSGYRLITNAGADARQEVPHLHFQLLAGGDLGTLGGL